MAKQQNDGWVKLWRQSLDSRVWQNPHLWQLWCYCLLRANHEGKWVSVTTGKGQTEVYVDPGQFIFGRFAAAKTLKANPISTYKRLLKLKSMRNVNTQNKAHYTLVSVCNWEFYQNGQAQSNTQVTPKEHPSNTNKNDNNVNNYSPTSEEVRLSKLLLTEIHKRKPDYKEPNLDKWARHIDLMIRLDKRTPERIEAVIRWAQQDSFWQNNILSTEKLRKQFDTLELKMGGADKIPASTPLYRLRDGRTPLETGKEPNCGIV